MTDRYAVIGHPVEHSKSPQIHAAFARQTGQDISYERILAPLDGFARTVAEMRAAGFRGANVTVPFKLEAFQLADRLSERASDAGAVNTLLFDGNGVAGDNTDGVGLVRDIQHNLGVGIHGRRVLLIGAGGAAEGVLHPILEQQPALLVITNRTLDKALRMVKRVEERGDLRLVSVQAQAFDELPGQAFDIVINATSAGLSDSELPLPAGIFAPGALAYDMMYGRETPFMKFARLQQARVADGLGMLVEQAAESFYQWRGVRPDTAPVIAAFRA
ncbi:MAG TPA: shikimate dehydrogenase [Methylophilaceae bacterium]